ncbi:uncharacterized protein GIQ15_05478 [Arthroderma uncinatum]|uniref:uncharacterized protein n=1 Tax=Arthroderma uncinatum TaxID=74035 RepID=UPI00144AE3A6|nr:uncharacterized protein GIQ15_05478 [Arthroderma uncinatum]KAF3480131.1 hypothetical protein GIQ15_05478 [Arthroderma uncinatum]
MHSSAARLATFFFALGAGAATVPNSTWPIQTYHSTDIRAGSFNTTKYGETEPGYIFVTPWVGGRSGHPSIYQDDGQLIWQGPEGNIYGFRPQTLHDEPMLVYWEGPFTKEGYGYGAVNLLNSSYHPAHKITLSDEYFKTIYEPQTFPSYIDLHEGIIENDKGSLLVAAVNVTQADLRSVGGPEDGWVLDSLIYDIDIATNKVLFRWSAVEHIDEIPFKLSQSPLDRTGTSEKNPWDFFRTSSTVRYGDDYLVSWGFGCSVLHIARNGTVAWNLSGINGGDFKLGPDANFCYQYGLRLNEYPDKNKITITMHNNANSKFSTKTQPTVGLVLDLDLQKMEAVRRRRLWNKKHPIVSRDLGSFQSLANGHILMNHGQIPVIEEYNGNDTLVMSLRYGDDIVDASYRVHRVAWTGTPTTKPSVKACRSTTNKEELTVYVSWNGVTDVESWKVYEALDGGELKEIKDEPRSGFETTVQAQSSGNKVVVAAVGGPNDGVKSEPVMAGSC